MKTMKTGAMLVEALLAVLILSISMIAILGNFGNSTNMAMRIQRQHKISTLVQYYSNDFFKQENLPVDETLEGNCPEPFEDCLYTIEVNEEEIDYEKTDFPDDLDKISPRYTIDLTLEIPMGKRNTYIYQTQLYYSNIDFLHKPEDALRFKIDDES